MTLFYKLFPIAILLLCYSIVTIKCLVYWKRAEYYKSFVTPYLNSFGEILEKMIKVKPEEMVNNFLKSFKVFIIILIVISPVTAIMFLVFFTSKDLEAIKEASEKHKIAKQNEDKIYTTGDLLNAGMQGFSIMQGKPTPKQLANPEPKEVEFDDITD